jgi:outer membrane protein assembly factor BamE
MDFLRDISVDERSVAPNEQLHSAATMIHHIVTPIVMPVHHRSPLLAGLIVTACTVLAGCSSTATSNLSTSAFNPVRWITPYRADVVQGNFISKEQVTQLRVGMSTLRRQGVSAQAFNYSVFFKGDLLERFEGDAMPSETDFIAKMDQRRKLGKVPPLEATPAQLEAAAKTMPVPSSADTNAAARTQPTVASYPPLESPRP